MYFCNKIKTLKPLKNLAGQTLVYGLGTMVPKLLNYVILTPYFTRLYNDPNSIPEYGKVTELYAYIVFLMVVLTYGMETTYFRYVNLAKDKRKVFSSIMTSIIFSSSIFIILVIVFTGSISAFLKFSGEPYFIRMLGGIVSVEAVSSIPFAKLRIENKARRFATLRVLQVILNIGIMLFIYNVLPFILGNHNFLLNASGIISAKYIFLANLLASSFVLLLLVPEFRDYKIKEFDFSLYKPMLLYSLPLLVSGLAGVINETLDRSIFKHVIKDTHEALYQLGLYGGNYKLASIVMIFVQMFRYAAEPFFFNYEKERDSKERYAQVMHIFIGLLILLGLVIVIYLDIFKYFLGKNYYEGNVIVPYIVLAYIFYGILFNLSIWFKLSHKTQYAIIITAIGAVITIYVNVKYIPVYSYHASAVAHVLSYFSMVLISFFLGRKYYRIPYDLKRVGAYFLLGFVLFFSDKYLKLHNIALIFLVKTILVMIFAIFVAWKENLLKILFKNT